jgi:hypothetical protein
VTFADTVLHLVRAGAQIDPGLDAQDIANQYELPEELPDSAGPPDPGADPASDSDARPEPSAYEPGLGDLEAAVALITAGLANRVVLSGFPSWPGLLWRAYQLAETTGVQILPTVVRPGGRVDIVITRDIAADG